MEDYKKIPAKCNPGILLRVIPGHFVTANSHINYFVDMSLMKARQSEARLIAKAISSHYFSSTVVDTILCVDGCDVIGAYLADYLSEAGILSMNSHKTIYITTPEFSITGQFLFRENMRPMIKDKHVLVLLASATTAKTLSAAINTIQYYGGRVAGISAIFSATEKVNDYPIHALFTPADLPDYQYYPHNNCPFCQAGKPIDALVNGFGYERIN